MNLFSPYRVLEDSEKKIRLQEPSWRKALLFFLFRLLPLLLIAGATIFMFSEKGTLPIHLQILLVAGAVLSASLMLFRPLVYEVIITNYNISLTRQVFLSVQEENITINEIDHVLVRMRRGKGGGLTYTLQLKNGKLFRFLHIPVINMSREKRELISTKISRLTGLPVKPAEWNWQSLMHLKT